MPRDTMILSGDHSIMMPHVPMEIRGNKVSFGDISDRYFEAAGLDHASIGRYGLFGDGLNYHTYYPDATKEDFTPSDEEFIEPVYRLLSNCIVSKNYNPTEFPAKVLKESMKLLVGQTVNCDHETSVGNAIGVIKEVSWQEEKKVDGVVIPAGINGVLKIDAKSNPRIARGINMDPPSIHSNSVTVQFEWKPSHQFEKEWEFYDKLGTIAEDGQLVRRIVTKIIAYRETSLVSHGADPFAQKIKDGKIVNPAYAKAQYYSFADQPPMEKNELLKHFGVFDYKSMESAEILSFSDTSITNNKQPENKTDMTLQEFLDQLYGEGMLTLAEGQERSTDLVISQLKDLLASKESMTTTLSQKDQEISTLKDQKASLETKVTELTDTIASQKSMFDLGTQHLADTRESVRKTYQKLMGEKADQTIINLIDTTDISTLKSLGTQYAQQLEEKFPMKCNHCGSTDVSRGSHVQENHDEEPEVKADVNSIVRDLANKR